MEKIAVTLNGEVSFIQKTRSYSRIPYYTAQAKVHNSLGLGQETIVDIPLSSEIYKALEEELISKRAPMIRINGTLEFIITEEYKK